MIDNDYTVYVMADSSNEAYLKNARDGTPMKTFYDSNMANNPAFLTKDNIEGKQVVSGLEKALYFGSTNVIIGDNSFVYLKMTDTVYGQIGWSFEKNSEFTEFFNYHIYQLFEGGLAFKV